MARKPTGNHNGRPPISIDWKQFDGFCKIQCSLAEIASFFNCSEKTIERKVQEHYGVGFAEYFSKKRIGGLISLRRNLFKQSEKSAAVAIFLAKNWLGMKDEQVRKHNVSNPIVLKVVYDNGNNKQKKD